MAEADLHTVEEEGEVVDHPQGMASSEVRVLLLLLGTNTSIRRNLTENGTYFLTKLGLQKKQI